VSDLFTRIFNLNALKDVTVSLDDIGDGSKSCLNISARLADERQCCPHCNNPNTTFKQKKIRQFLLPPINSTKVVLSITVKKCRCKSCNKLWWPTMAFSEGKQRFTHAFELYAIGLLRYATVKDVADHLDVNWNVIKSIHKRYLEKTYEHIDLAEVEYLSVDEIAIRKGHTYMTIFSDALTGRIVHAVRGKKKADISPFLRSLKKKAPRLKAIAMDMCKSYIAAVKEILPGIDIVYDRFHVMKLINKAVDEIRKSTYGSTKRQGNPPPKKTRFLFLKGNNLLTDKEEKKLEAALEQYEPLMIAYLMKERLRLFWNLQDKEEARRFLVDWCFEVLALDAILVERSNDEVDVEANCLKPLLKVAKTLLEHIDGLLSYIDHSIDNGRAEGINNKIKTLKRQAYGYRDDEYFKLRLYHLHIQKHQLAG